jgi:hypothetical protein
VEIGTELGRTWNSCRRTYQVHFGELRPRKQWTAEEDWFVKKRRAEGWRFDQIASQMMGRSRTEVRHRWEKLTHKFASVTVKDESQFEWSKRMDQDGFEFPEDFWDDT